MEEVQTDTLSDYGKNQPQETVDLDPSKESETTCAATLLNGCDEIDDALDLMDHSDHESNSDVWKGSDSEDDSFDNKDHSTETNKEIEESNNEGTNKGTEEASNEKSNQQTDLDSGKVVENENKKEEVKNPEVSKEKETEAEINTVEEENEAVSNTAEKENEAESNTAEKENEAEINAVEKESEESPDKDKTDGNDKAETAQKEAETVEKTVSRNVDLTKDNEAEDKVEKQPDNPAPEATQKPPDIAKEPSEPAKSPNVVNGETNPLSSETNENQTGKDPLSLGGSTKTTEKNTSEQPNELVDDECPMDYDAEDDDDFDPSLLCPEVSMAVDDNEVVTSNGPVPNDGEVASPSPLEPLFSTFVDEVTGAEISFNLSMEEMELKKRMYGPTNPIQITKLHCTACNIHLGSALEGQNNRFVHPLLKVLICKKCYHFYTSGDFDKDEDGSELYCRWCGQGGQVLCCSKCEFVFCKRCIRTNFGRKKMFEIRDSDSWDCFRCNQSQIITQRIACYEFFEYIRREMALASTLNSPEIWSKDHSRCCLAKKRPAENGEEIKKAKKKKGDVDPDYDPKADKMEATATQSPPLLATITVSNAGTQFLTGNKGILLPKPIQILPRFTMAKSKDNDIEFVRQIPAPHVTINTMPRPAYRTIIPSVRPAMQPPTFVRISSQPGPPPLSPQTNRMLGSALQGRAPTSSPIMKHEWFEKTVRAAARVNSHLSYTLTQLNKAQSQAASVEELAVVHNKLQEILSSSINSLIQIRKNLRTEFIAGIKTVRLPSKKAENNDDDVILVSAPTTMPMPSTSMAKQQPAKDPLAIETPPKTDSVTKGAEKPKSYLKVKSFKELQNVPSECITIPDDPPMPPKPDANKEKDAPVEIISNGDGEEKAEASKNVDPLADAVAENAPSTSNSKKTSDTVPNGSTSATQNSEIESDKNKEAKRRSKLIYSVKDEPSADIKRMMAVKVNVTKDDLEELQKKLANKK